MIEALDLSDAAEVAALWEVVGLTRPWNDPLADFGRALAGASSTVLGHRVKEVLLGTVMVGHDGHRGWVYYLAVRPDHQGQGLGAKLMHGAEEWLEERGVVKVQLMVRTENERVTAFYEYLGYETSDVSVLAKWLSPGA